MKKPEPPPIFFTGPDEFRAWLHEHHDSEDELWVGYWRKATGKPTMTWTESVRVALCYGWIDGIRKSIDDERYRMRFTPRRRNSHWSQRNLQHMKELIASGEMQQSGLAAFEARDPERVEQYSFEREHAELAPEYVKILKQNRAAWRDWEARPPGYRRQVTWWIMSAKREDTRLRRLEKLIEHGAAGEKIPPLS